MREDQDPTDRRDPTQGDWFAANAPPPPPVPTNVGPIPTNPDGTQVGGGIPWNAGEDHPSSAPPGYHWDPALAMFQPDAAVTPTSQPPGGGGTTTVNGGNQFSGYGGGDPTGFGVPSPPYASNPHAPTYTAPPKPTSLQSPYVAPVWQGGNFQAPTKPTDLQSEFRAPTQAELEASPGYQARLTAGTQARERSAAAHGTILNGGTQVALDQGAQDYASNEYSNLFGQSLNTRQQNVGEYNTDFTQGFNQYLQKYKQFTDAAGMGLNARQQQQGEYASDVTIGQQGYQNQYTAYLGDNSRTLSDYLTNATQKRTAETDYWGRLRDLSGNGLDAAKNSVIR